MLITMKAVSFSFKQFFLEKRDGISLNLSIIHITGSSTLASTFSNGAKDPNTGVATTDLYGKCTTTHSGTSAAAPEAAGVFALALEAK